MKGISQGWNRLLKFTHSKIIYIVLFTFLAPVLFTGLGIASGYGIYHIHHFFDSRSIYRKLPEPPADPVHLFDIGSGYVRILASDKNIYTYSNTNKNKPDPWKLCTDNWCREPSEYMIGDCPEDAFPPIPRNTIQVVESCIGIENWDNTRVVLFDDGTLKMYRVMTTNAYALFLLGFLLIYGGGFIGFIIGVVLVIKMFTANHAQGSDDPSAHIGANNDHRNSRPYH